MLDLMTPEELADYLKVSLRTIYSYAQKGKIPAFKIVGQWRFDRDEIESWLESLKNKGR
jgi:excisionase family DNA binding protein